jgi:hypothetical protein
MLARDSSPVSKRPRPVGHAGEVAALSHRQLERLADRLDRLRRLATEQTPIAAIELYAVVAVVRSSCACVLCAVADAHTRKNHTPALGQAVAVHPVSCSR